MFVRYVALWLVLAGALACTTPRGRGGHSLDGGGTTDAPANGDSGAVDAGTPPLDAGALDAGAPPLDAGAVDAGRHDGGPPTCDESPCRLMPPQCGCATGTACDVRNTGAALVRECRPTGTRPAFSACSARNECAAGTSCIILSSTGTPRHCAPFCRDDTDCDVRAGSGCVAEVDGTGVCTTPCDPVRRTGCPMGARCSLYADAAAPGRRFTECRGPVGTGVQGSPCETTTDCGAGYLCQPMVGCLAWCLVATGLGCPTGTTCSQFGDPVLLNDEELGYCA